MIKEERVTYNDHCGLTIGSSGSVIEIRLKQWRGGKPHDIWDTSTYNHFHISFERAPYYLSNLAGHNIFSLI